MLPGLALLLFILQRLGKQIFQRLACQVRGRLAATQRGVVAQRARRVAGSIRIVKGTLATMAGISVTGGGSEVRALRERTIGKGLAGLRTRAPS